MKYNSLNATTPNPSTPSAPHNEIIHHQPASTLKLDVRVAEETVWLNRHQIATLFGRDVKTIGKHIANALKEELEGSSVVANICDNCCHPL